ncbi:FdtA/QdtA family cupin domain-containing protein [Candidatus Nitrosopelagicus sp.]|nr:FdtA/QdtA family cupin domain-containing protein [Candidatus Nitrosopelagicus sp.]
MSEKGFFVQELERHDTKDVSDSHINGELTVIWRDWDNIIKEYPKMVYVNTVNSGEIKGPHLHKNRTTYFSCIQGEIIIVIRDDDGSFHEIRSNTQKPSLICVKNGIAAAIINPTKEISKVLVLADIAWRPNDNEMENVEFVDYDFDKWV